MQTRSSPSAIFSEPLDGLLRIDMHTHSSYSVDAVNSPQDLLRSWQKTGIIPLVCDHDTLEGSLRVMRAIHAGDPGIPVVLAEEVTTREGEIIGLFLSEEIPPGLPAAETIELIHGQGGISLLPHPFCSHRVSVLTAKARNALVDGIDLVEGHNARNRSDDDDRLAVLFATEMGIPFTVGSDAHTPLELGRVWMEIPAFGTPGELLRGLAGAPYTFRRMNSGVHLISGMVKGFRKTFS
jgi:predicted metal-dependent phosphoesterase TrpH